ncbi:phosphatidylinositol-3-phosphatase ymr1 [Blastocladiella emersonii ATCC 22665]|nr:phosphatidylinositol-3-phosphatase ymr1 [Blastocladiella emersonii ATCC 22665]
MEHIRIAKVDNVLLMKGKRAYLGTLHLLAHQLIFRYADSGDEVWVFYSTVHDIERHPLNAQMQVTLDIHCRNFLFIRLLVQNEAHANDVHDSLVRLVHLDSPDQFYAFHFRLAAEFAPENDGWALFDLRREFERLGVGSRHPAWRFSEINADYAVCGTYPRVLAVPSTVLDSTLRHAAKYRSKGRVPALTYLHPTGASISRCSQPLVGLKQNRSPQDEKLVECILTAARVTGTSPGVADGNLIVDARPAANAMANTAKGAGTEIMEYYKCARKEFMGIDNIHVMRDSLARMIGVIQQAEIDGAPVDLAALDKSGWLRHVKLLLEGTQVVVDTVARGAHVLVHCSDGWDRTSQFCALAQVCLDPYYRTLAGFAVLVEKDWLAFGHKFSDRCGHLTPAAADSATAVGVFAKLQTKVMQTVEQREVSPVFHQFLDCVYQLVCEQPAAFEFNEQFLVDLHYHVYSCQFGTFLFNCDADRARARLRERTHSVWSMILAEAGKYTNPGFTGGDRNGEPRTVLSCRPRRLRYWTGLLNCPADLAVDMATMQLETPGTVTTLGNTVSMAPPSPSLPAPLPAPALVVDETLEARDPALSPLTPLSPDPPASANSLNAAAAAAAAAATASTAAIADGVSRLWSRWTTSPPTNAVALQMSDPADPLGHQAGSVEIATVAATRGSLRQSNGALSAGSGGGSGSGTPPL